MKILAVVQARMGSTRLPNKVMRTVSGVPLIEILFKRLSKSTTINQIILATSLNKNNFPLIEHIKSLNYDFISGSENDVLSRYVLAADKFNSDIIVRITGDCPLIDPSLVDYCVNEFLDRNVDYLSNTSPPSYPDGLDVEVFSSKALKRAYVESTSNFDREHVTPYIRNSGLFKVANVSHTENYSDIRLTIDEAADLHVIEAVFDNFKPDFYFSWLDVISLYKVNSKIFSVNREINRNEGMTMGNGQKLWKRAKTVIPGGNMLLSKRAEMFLPNQWPSYYSRAKGCKVWDLDGVEYTDMSIMGIGTNTLGYGQDQVDNAVRKCIDAGNMSTLNCPEEVYLAEKLIEMHSWADMARFARSGGEANAVAIRIARAASGKDNVAICGYHGWHDWYLSTNLGDDKGLDGHLLPGLEPNGVPRTLKNTVFPFNYNDFSELERIVNDHDIGVIKMEVIRNYGPEDNFLHKVRELATRKNIVLIFDECTSGFRETFGGIHKKYGVNPDMAMFGKALGNGYAITAVIGKRAIMEAAQSTFISSTFWTERVGPTAALETLNVMEKISSWEDITNKGVYLKSKWANLASKYELKITQWGLPSLAGFSFLSQNALAYKTYITQEMLKRNYLVGNSVYVCTEHSLDVIDGYIDHLDELFNHIRQCEDGKDIYSMLDGPVCHASFKRLN